MTDPDPEGWEVVLLAHGSPDPRHREDIEFLAESVGEVGGWRVRAAYLDHHGPTPGETGAALAGHAVVVVPTFLTEGHHVRVDVPPAVAALRAAGATVTCTRALADGPGIARARAEVARSEGVPVEAVGLFLARGILHDRFVAERGSVGERAARGTLGRTRAFRDLVLARVRGEGMEHLSVRGG